MDVKRSCWIWAPGSSRNEFLPYATIRPVRLYQSLFSLIALAVSVFTQELQPLADRIAVQNSLFDEQYASDLRNFPQDATAYGDCRYSDKLADESLAVIAQRN